MRKKIILAGALLGAVTSLGVIGLGYLGWQALRLPFLPFDLFDWMARALPGALITTVIHSIVSIIRGLNLGPTDTTAKLIEQSIALGQFVGGGAVLGAALAWAFVRRPRTINRIAVGLGGGLTLVSLAIEAALGQPPVGWPLTLLWLAALNLAWALGLARIMRGPTGEPSEPVLVALQRRQFLTVLGGALGIGLGSFVIARWLQRSVASPSPQPLATNLGAGETSGPAASPSEAELAARIQPAPGTRAELTPNAAFYRIDINTLPPSIDGGSWRLSLDGLVGQPQTYTIQDLLNRPSASQVVTMQCISNPVGGDLTSTSRWTGVPLKVLLAEAGLRGGAQAIQMESEDGFYESLSIDEAMDERVLLVYAMNDAALPVEHGFPLRIYIPGHYGMKQPKWLTHMEVIANPGRGYWVERGWSQTAIPQTTSVIDTVAVEAADPKTGTVPVGGIAWSGDRGISKVEVQVDGGDWMAAKLRTPPLSPLSWVQWRLDWPMEKGSHEFKVRSYDGAGQLQVLSPGDPYPDGATGVDTYRARI